MNIHFILKEAAIQIYKIWARGYFPIKLIQKIFVSNEKGILKHTNVSNIPFTPIKIKFSSKRVTVVNKVIRNNLMCLLNIYIRVEYYYIAQNKVQSFISLVSNFTFSILNTNFSTGPWTAE